jgi:multiple sugar transport system permease protein
MTKGGPLMSTTTIPIMIYNEAFTRYDIGKASAMAMVIFMILAVISIIYIRVFENVEKRVIE